MIMKLIRNGLGEAIVVANNVFKPKQIKRNSDEQIRVNEACMTLSLYQFHRCYFCTKVRRVMSALKLDINLKNANENEDYNAELLSGGGKRKVPCLRIDEDSQVTWMYNSKDIISYLSNRFGPQP
jgi:Glutathione S-transferase